MGQTRNRAPDKKTLVRLDAMIEPIREFMAMKGKDNSIFQEKSLTHGIWTFVNKKLSEQGLKPRSSNDYSRNKEYILNKLNIQHEEPIQALLMPSEHTEPSVDSEPLEPSDRPDCLDQAELNILRIVNEQLDIRIAELKQAVQINQDNLLLPPDRVKIKGDKNVLKETRTHAKFSTTVDARLLELFDKECGKRKMRRSELLDAVLYTYFDKPKLSNEK